MNGKRAIGFVVLLLSLALPAWPVRAQTSESDSAWAKALLEERAAKDAEFKNSPTSPLAGRERLMIAAAAAPLPSIRDGKLADRAATGAASSFTVQFSDGEWYWKGGSGVACRRGESPVAMERQPLAPGDLFAAGRLTLAAYPGAEALTLIVFDPQRPQLREFERLRYFPPDRNYAVKARLERFPAAKPLKITTTRNLEKTFYRYGRLRFRLGGRDLELTALKTSLEGPDARLLFVPFKDDSNGRETYEVGRFLDLEEPPGEELLLDFNRCYNPLCNYSPAYNCPLPPLENFLDIEINAGEKTYPH